MNKDKLLIRLVNRINNTILPLCYKYNINCGGCGVFAVLLSRQLEKYCLNIKIKASFLGNNSNFYNAEHYSIIIEQRYEINKFKLDAKSTQDMDFTQVNQADLYWLKNACDGYNHKHDIEIKEIINNNI